MIRQLKLLFLFLFFLHAHDTAQIDYLYIINMEFYCWGAARIFE